MNDKEFEEISKYIKQYCGINLSSKKTLVESRLSTYITKKGFSSFASYFNYALNEQTGDEFKHLISVLTTNHTFFMRESKHFTYFKETVLPILVKNSMDKDLRIWSAGCSTGEEPYTLAIIIDEFFGADKNNWDTKILATDISENVIEIAKKGSYTEEQMELVSDVWKLNYFDKIDKFNYVVKDKIKNEIILRCFNLMANHYPFKKKFHVIFCRNVMIYFDYETKLKLLNKFYDILEPGGYLFLGYSESININDTLFRYVIPSVYQKRLD